MGYQFQMIVTGHLSIIFANQLWKNLKSVWGVFIKQCTCICAGFQVSYSVQKVFIFIIHWFFISFRKRLRVLMFKSAIPNTEPPGSNYKFKNSLFWPFCASLASIFQDGDKNSHHFLMGTNIELQADLNTLKLNAENSAYK